MGDGSTSVRKMEGEGENRYDVSVVGAGHAGCEAALAAARLGANTLLLTLSLDKIAWQVGEEEEKGLGRGEQAGARGNVGGEPAVQCMVPHASSAGSRQQKAE